MQCRRLSLFMWVFGRSYRVPPRASIRDKIIVVETANCVKQLTYILLVNMDTSEEFKERTAPLCGWVLLQRPSTEFITPIIAARPSPFSALIPVSENVIDYLHCFQEGVLKMFLQGCLKPLSPLRVNNSHRAQLEEMATKARLPTYVKNFLRSPSDVKKLSGSEIEMLGMAFVPVAVAENLIACKKRAAVVLQSVIIANVLQNCHLRLLRDRVKTVETALSVVKKKVYQKSRDETLTASKDFGVFTIPYSSYGPGSDLSALYTRLQHTSRVPSSTSEYANFFNNFIHHVVPEMYSRDVWPLLSVRTRKRKNQYVDFESELVINFVKAMYEKANKEVRTSFYVDVFHMITVALTNFRRNMKSQEAAEHSTNYAAIDNDTIPSQPSSQSTDGGLKGSQRSVDSAESDASMALSFFDYSQE
ncbi:unnamed protein product [Heligmosomoides polygyrus]|uniref:DUF4806 domain-containing protein n=1 Tax=Heligmosomoides polygyrus TaxID=6339 RepID=A0A183G282_HELPZ|nr:unnamed protein product [Heligmosomoides polygyrus]